MANMRAIRNRIKSIENTRQVTLSMRMVSAAKLRKTQTAWNDLKDYARTAREILLSVAAAAEAEKEPLFAAREGKKRCYVLFLGNRGLCGAYNTALIHYASELFAAEEGEKSLVVVGRWGREQVAALGLPVLRRFDAFSDTPTAGEARELGDYLKELFLSGETDRVVLVYQRFLSALSQQPTELLLLPLQCEAGESGEYIFEPDPETLLASVSELSYSNTLLSTLLEARTGEHAARMTAMSAATDNTDELIRKLSLKLNHARQSAITTEISEIVGGANALNQ